MFEILEVLGYEHVQYVNKSGRQVIGMRLYLVYDSDRVTGSGCESVWISGDLTPPALGSKVRLMYNRFGRCISFQLID